MTSRWDLLGAATALACAVHCGLGPLLFLLAPLLGVVVTGDETVHRIAMVLAPPAALLAFAPGYAAHRRRSVLVLGATGVALLAGAALPWVEHSALEAALGAAGGASLFIAHLRNRRLCRCCATGCGPAAAAVRSP